MEFTPGIIMIIAGVTGITGCIITLVILKGIFARQRKKLLEEIEKE